MNKSQNSVELFKRKYHFKVFKKCCKESCDENGLAMALFLCIADDICLLPKPKFTFMCEKLSKRYYFDSKRGLCRKFWGCEEVTGNSFNSKKECKKSCYSRDEKLRDRKERVQQKTSDSSSLPGRCGQKLLDNSMQFM